MRYYVITAGYFVGEEMENITGTVQASNNIVAIQAFLDNVREGVFGTRFEETPISTIATSIMPESYEPMRGDDLDTVVRA